MTTNRERADHLTAALHAIVDGDTDALDALLADDVRIWTPEVSTAELDEFLTVLGRRDDAFSDVRLDVVPLDVSGDYACAEWTVELVHSGAFELADGSSLDPSGRRLVLHGVTVAEFAGGEICSLRQYWDRFDLLEQLGPASG
jgi:ketosteroid isomerase-like protein